MSLRPIGLAALIMSAPLAAQMPMPAPGPSLAQAQRGAAAALKACKGVPIAVAVLDSGGGLKLAQTGDGASTMFADFARRKAMTALKFGRPSAAVRDEAKSDPALAQQLATDPALIGFGGGVPFAGGAIAVAGAPRQDTDERCARAGLAAMGIR